MTPIPDNSPATEYCNLVEQKLNQLKTENILCSNSYDTYELCSLQTNSECSF